MLLRRLFVRAAAVLVCCLAVAVPHTEGAASAWQSWSAELHRDHSLVGKIWSANERKFISVGDMAALLRQARFVLLGEIHDNPDHHRLQAWAIRTVGKGGRKPAVVMEMLSDGQAPAIRKFHQDSEHCCRLVLARDFFKAVNWSESGWPSAEIYQPIVEAALGVHARLAPGSVTNQQLRAVARADAEQMTKGLAGRLGLAQKLPPALAKDLRQELKESHCKMLPERALPAMVRVQRLRDAVMADRLVQAKRHAVLIAGNGHVRADRGVPLWLRKYAPRQSIIVVTQAEVEPGRTDPRTYGPHSPVSGWATDVIWFTPRTKRPDPCEEMKRHMRARKKKK